jgi:HAD superfamily hydrolase (TIGR01509 family)
MTIRAAVFDIGGVLEIVPGGGDPTKNFTELIDRWNERLHRPPGDLHAKLKEMDKRLASMGKDPGLGTCSEEDWHEALRSATSISQEQLDAFLLDYWNVYLGAPNQELMEFFKNLRPAYRTALLSNSDVGARREEQQRYHFNDMTDLIIYSHEEGVKKPNPRIFAIACERLGMQPGEIVFLDDAAVNVTAAREYGIHAILFQNNAQAISAIEAELVTSRQ